MDLFEISCGLNHFFANVGASLSIKFIQVVYSLGEQYPCKVKFDPPQLDKGRDTIAIHGIITDAVDLGTGIARMKRVNKLN